MRAERNSKMVSKNYCTRLLGRTLLLSLAACLSLLWPQSNSERVTVGQPQKVVGKRSDSVETRIPVAILEGFHVNSNTPSEEYLIPLKVRSEEHTSELQSL